MAEGKGRASRWLSVLCGLVLAGCAVGGPLEAPTGPPPMPHLDAIGGTALAVTEWPTERPQAVIIAVHGYGDYGPSTFALAAKFWAGQGISTYAYDQRGFGRNVSFGRWPGAEALVGDLLAVAKQVRARHACTPLIVVGHSMGGGVALAAAGQGLDADGLVLAAPAIWGGAELNPLYRVAAWGAAAFVPERRFTGEGVVSIQASDNIEMLRALGHDPRYLYPPSAREIFGLVRVTDMAEAAAENVGLPALLLLGDKDEIVPNARVRRVFDRLTGQRLVIEYPDGWHLLFRDLQAERVWRDVAEWSLAIPRDAACGAGSGYDQRSMTTTHAAAIPSLTLPLSGGGDTAALSGA
ncbi:MAG TPA: alpha/beta fold hydrolase [Thermohalobaculum sp.]|nr:alpha/beta fold hydrolase [Thermohalobaculum sp.]